MDFFELEALKQVGVMFDAEKARGEVKLSDNGGDGGSIIGYFPSENLQVLIHNIHTTQIPDFGLDFGSDQKYLRVNICKYGRCEFINGQRSKYLCAGEAAIDRGQTDDSSFVFSGKDYVGIEIVMQPDQTASDFPLLEILRKSLTRLQPSEQQASLFFTDASDYTMHMVDELIRYAIEGSDSDIITIKSAEILHNLGTDLADAKSKLRTFATNTQAEIARDVFETLTNSPEKRVTAATFARRYNISETAVKNYFKNIYGHSFMEFRAKVRMEKAAQLLSDSNLSIADVAQAVGYKSRAKFSDAFRKRYDLTPSEYRLKYRAKHNAKQD